MSSFKKKSVKADKHNKIYHIETKHREMIKNIKFEEKNIAKYETLLNENRNELLQLENTSREIYQQLDAKIKKDEDKTVIEKLGEMLQVNIKQKIQLKYKINTLEEKIKRLVSSEKLLDYYKNVGNVLFDIYNQNKTEKTEENKEISVANSMITDGTLDCFIKKAVSNENKYIMDDYMPLVDKSYIKPVQISERYKMCDICGNEKTINVTDANLVCETCGTLEKYMIDNEKPNFKDPHLEKVTYSYTRGNHFNEFINCFQAKETTTISDEIYKQIENEIMKNRIDKLNISFFELQYILKKIGYSGFYEHIPHILRKTCGVMPPIIPKHLENKMRWMFNLSQEVFNEISPYIDRTNFLNYSFAIYKIFEMVLGEKHTMYTRFLKKLKTKKRLFIQDKIWEQICKELAEYDFVYIKTPLI